MPEGPEIRRAADQLSEAVVGEPLRRIFFAFPALKKYERSLVKRRIESITPHGKALLTRFDNGQTLYSHNQLYGVWKVTEPGVRNDGARSLRVALETSERAILLFSASDVAMWPNERLHEHPFLAKLGPDILDPSLDPGSVEALFDDPRFAGRALSALLLDQAFLAGMGNYLRSEVLFEARLSPNCKPRELDPSARRRLAEALLAVPARSYRSPGIEPAQGMKGDYITDTPIGFRFHVFDREGLPCGDCGRKIVRRELAGRRLYFCARCQA